MPETYPGQTEVVRAKLAETELLLQANRERLGNTSQPQKRQTLLRLIAEQSGTAGSYKRQLQKCQADTDCKRTETYKIRFSPAERGTLENKAANAGQTLAQYIRQQCGL